MMPNLLIGKTITSMKIASDKMTLLFTTSEGESLIASTDGDCCSHSWIESVELPVLGFPFTILSINDLDLPSPPDSEHDHECLQVYGAKLTTDKGDMIIDYRNESNGYYGGWMNWPGDTDSWVYGGVYGQNISSEGWIELESA